VAGEELKLPNSLWAATAVPAPDCAPLDGEQSSDVCVIGGGFTGLSAALHLAEAGTAVTLLEAVEPGYGASGRNGGHFIPGWKVEPEEIVKRFGPARGPRLARCVAGSADFTYRLIRRLEIDCHARQSGWIRAAHSDAEAALGRRRAEKADPHGMKVEWLEPDRLAAITGTNLYKGGLLYPSGGMLQPLSYARGLAAAGMKAGAAIHGRPPVVDIKPAEKGWRIIAAGGTVHADQVVICTNGYSDLAGGNGKLWPDLIRSIVPLYSYQVATKPLSDNLRRTILPDGQAVADTRRLLGYFGVDHSGRLLMGGRGGFRESADPDDYRRVIADLRRIFPQLGEPELDFYWGGKVAITPDHIPHLHEPAPGILAGLGYNGRGVAMASLMGKLLADRALGMAAEESPLPSTKIKPIPGHGVRTPAIKLITTWKRFRDRLELRGG
jgi:glycine/D-amino acid oxidase-like deaminating enzyme